MKNSSVDFGKFIEHLPPIMARQEVPQYLGGVISSKTLANLDTAGMGPPRIRIGRKIIYPTAEFLKWLSDRAVQLES